MPIFIGICSDNIKYEGKCICGTCLGKCEIRNQYSELAINCGFIPIIIPVTLSKLVLEEICKIIDCLLICGNILYPRNGIISENIDKNIIMNKLIHDRDTLLVDIMIKMNKKIIGICYGMQFLNSYFNGKIYIDIEKQLNVKSHMKTKHPVKILKNTKLYDIFIKNKYETDIIVNSFHYAGIRPDILSNKFIINTISDDNIVEGVETENGNIFGFQYHVEKHKELFFIIKDFVELE